MQPPGVRRVIWTGRLGGAPTEHDPDTDTFNIIVAIAARGDTPVPNTLVAERTITRMRERPAPGT